MAMTQNTILSIQVQSMNSFLTSAFLTPHLGQSRGRLASHRIWSRLGSSTLGGPDGQAAAFVHADDFGNFGSVAPAISGAVSATNLGYRCYTDTATTTSSISQRADEDGVIRLACGATANHGVVIAQNNDVGSLGQIKASGGPVVAFEARVRFGQVANIGAALGLFAPGIAAVDALSTTGLTKATDFVGFILTDNGAKVKFAYRPDSGGSAQLLAGWEMNVTADTWYKLGFVVRPQEEAEFLTVLVNSQIVGYLDAAICGGANFPHSTPLLAAAALKAYAGSAVTMDMDWLAAGKAA